MDNIKSEYNIKYERKMGRPRTIIDWEKVKELVKAGCSAGQIAPTFAIDEQTLRVRCEEDNIDPLGNPWKWSEFKSYYSRAGEQEILTAQHNLVKKEDRIMLIWAGKQRLGQSETIKQEIVQTLHQVDAKDVTDETAEEIYSKLIKNETDK